MQRPTKRSCSHRGPLRALPTWRLLVVSVVFAGGSVVASMMWQPAMAATGETTGATGSGSVVPVAVPVALPAADIQAAAGDVHYGLVASAEDVQATTTTGGDQSSGGAAVFSSSCARCHGDDGAGAEEGPSVRGIPQGTDPAEVAALVREGIIEDGHEVMPAFGEKLSSLEIDEVAAYVVGLGEKPNVVSGGELYRLNCAGCHGASGRGGALISGDVNAPTLMGVPVPDLVGAIRGGPGAMPSFNQAAVPDTDVASITAYVETLQNPPRPGGFGLGYYGPVTEGLIALVVGLGAAVLGSWWIEKGGRG